MSCPVCASSRASLLSSRKNARGHRLKRHQCKVCHHRWTTRDGIHESHSETREVDWRVPANGDGCKECFHYCRGFCSLGFPEARDPGFVAECEARMVESAVCVVH